MEDKREKAAYSHLHPTSASNLRHAFREEGGTLHYDSIFSMHICFLLVVSSVA